MGNLLWKTNDAIGQKLMKVSLIIAKLGNILKMCDTDDIWQAAAKNKVY